MAWVLTKGLQKVRAEFNSVFFGRDKASDGAVGDLAHQTGTSGHNPDLTGRAEYKDGDKLDEVRAIDVDKDLRHPTVTMEKVVQHIVTMARAGKYVPFRYIIFNGRIWARTSGWATKTYTGSNRHGEHAHFSGDRSEKADNWDGLLGFADLVKPKPAPKPKPPAGKLPVHKPGSRENSMKVNSRGTDVATLQRFLGERRAGAADGQFGDKTADGVRWYQRDIMELPSDKIDGIAGPRTWAPILKALK